MSNKTSNISLLSESFRLLFKNYVVFAPLLVSFALSVLFVFTPYYRQYMFFALQETPPPVNVLIGFFAYVFLLLIVGYIVYGWIMALINSIITNKKFTLLSELKSGLRIAISLFILTLLGILIYIFLIVVIVIAAIIASFLSAASAILGMIFTAILVISGVLFFLFLISYSMQLIGVMITEKKGPIISIRLAWRHCRKNLGHSLFVFLMSLAIFLAAYLPILAVFFGVMGFGNNANMLLLYNAKYNFIFIVGAIPITIAQLWLLVFYGIDYKKRKVSG